MIIVAGETSIYAQAIIKETMVNDGGGKPILRVMLSGGISESEIAALKAHDWHVYEDDGVREISMYQGYDQVVSHDISFAAAPDLEAEVAMLRIQLETSQAANAQAAQYREALIRAGINPDEV